MFWKKKPKAKPPETAVAANKNAAFIPGPIMVNDRIYQPFAIQELFDDLPSDDDHPSDDDDRFAYPLPPITTGY